MIISKTEAENLHRLTDRDHQLTVEGPDAAGDYRLTEGAWAVTVVADWRAQAKRWAA